MKTLSPVVVTESEGELRVDLPASFEDFPLRVRYVPDERTEEEKRAIWWTHIGAVPDAPEDPEDPPLGDPAA